MNELAGNPFFQLFLFQSARCINSNTFRQLSKMIAKLDNKQADEAAGKLMHSFSRSLVDKENSTFRSNFRLPSLVEISGNARIFSEESEFDRLFTSINEYCTRNEIEDVVSMLESAEYLSDMALGITGVLCFMKANNVRFQKPFPIYFLANHCTPDWTISCLILPTLDEPEFASAFELSWG